MAQDPDEAWFYSQGGQQLGPIPFSELQAKVNANELDPFKDLVWKVGMDSWTPVGQVRDTFKEASSPTPEPKPTSTPSPSPKPEPGSATTQDPESKSESTAESTPEPVAKPAPEPTPEPKPAPVPAADAKPAAKSLPPIEAKPKPKPQAKPTSQRGIQQPAPMPADKKKKKKDIPEAKVDGANRGHYILGVWLIPIAVMGIFFYLAISGTFTSLGEDMLALIGLGVTLFVSLIAIVVTLMRLTNLAMSRWWILGNLVPLLNLWLGYRLFACPHGYAAGRKMDGLGILLAIVYWLSLIAVVAAVPVMMVIALTGLLDNPEVMNDPEMRKEINQMLIELRDLIKEM